MERIALRPHLDENRGEDRAGRRDKFMSGYELPWGQIMATGKLVALPVIIFSMIVSRQLVRGLTAGAIK